YRDHYAPRMNWRVKLPITLNEQNRGGALAQEIDQRLTVVDPPPPFYTRPSVPQCPQPLAAERGGGQFLFRRDGNLARVHCDWCLVAERDSVIADDVDAHGWVLLLSRGRCRG